MKKTKIFLLFIFILMLLNIKITYAAINSPYYGIYNAENMELLEGEKTKEKIPIASITKVMTAIVSIENIQDVNDKIIIDTNLINGKVDPVLSKIGIFNQEELTYYDLIATMLVKSGADSAIYLQNIVFNDENEFINKMNEKASEIGMKNTKFSNVTGLDDENNYSTIEDVAIMMNYALKNENLRKIMMLKEYTTTDNSFTVNSTISLLAKTINLDSSVILGGKTGTTEKAGICLASFSEDKEDDVELICVTAGCNMYSLLPYNLIDTINLYNSTINDYNNITIISKGQLVKEIPTHLAKQENIEIYADKDIKKYLKNFNKEKIQIIYDGLDNVEFYTKIGKKLGTVKYYYDSDEIGEMDVILKQNLKFDIKKFMKEYYKNILLTLTIISIIIIFIIKINSKKSIK